ncbi:hypothetical protein BH09MYX1_BH09MYX1_60580 [soil metagenome]
MAGSPLQARARGRVGSMLKDKWQLESLLGVGGTAAVYAATHRNGKRAAIKILHHELSGNEELVGRFLREGYVANKLEHPGAVSVLDDDRADDGSVFLVMELFEGYSLERHTRTNAERLTIEQVVRIGDEVLDVLAIAHTKGVIHRDIKPANLFLTREGKLKVLDFGIARLREGNDDVSATQTGAAIGTPAFMPPEQARGRWDSVDARTDIWSVGATLFALLTGDRPRRAETVNEELLLAMTQPVPKLATAAPHVPAGVAAVVDRAVAFEMNDRYPDARAMQLALRQAMAELHHHGDGELVPSAQPDTAPVLRGGEIFPTSVTLAMPLAPPQPDTLDPRYTTSRPILTETTAPTAQRASAPWKAVVLSLSIIVVVCGVGIGGFLKYQNAHASTNAASTEPTERGASAATSLMTSAATSSSAAGQSGAATDPGSASVSSMPIDSLPLATATGKGGIRSTPSAHGSASAKPTATAAGSGNPWDSRF